VPRHKDAERNQVMSETRGLLLGAATEEFAREGYNGANINRISQAAGFAKGTVYNYFASKRALMLALIDEIAASHHQFVAEQVRQEEAPVRRLQLFFQAGYEWISLNLAQGKVMLTMLNGPDVESIWESVRPWKRGDPGWRRSGSQSLSCTGCARRPRRGWGEPGNGRDDWIGRIPRGSSHRDRPASVRAAGYSLAAKGAAPGHQSVDAGGGGEAA